MPPKTDNRTNGGRFEQELARQLYNAGFWVHVLQQNKAGQPADLIVCKGAFCTLIDCKVISGPYFPLSRVEENQRYAMQRFSDRTDNACWFAMKLPDGNIRLMSSMFIFDAIQKGLASIPNGFIMDNGITLEDWTDGTDFRCGTTHNDFEDDLK